MAKKTETFEDFDLQTEIIKTYRDAKDVSDKLKALDLLVKMQPKLPRSKGDDPIKDGNNGTRAAVRRARARMNGGGE